MNFSGFVLKSGDSCMEFRSRTRQLTFWQCENGRLMTMAILKKAHHGFKGVPQIHWGRKNKNGEFIALWAIPDCYKPIAGAEDRALLESNPSADFGGQTGREIFSRLVCFTGMASKRVKLRGLRSRAVAL